MKTPLIIKAIKELGRAALENTTFYQREAITKIAPYIPQEMVATWRSLSGLVESDDKLIDGVEEKKILAEEVVAKEALLDSIVHAINIDKVPLRECGFTSMDECLSFFEECDSKGYSIEYLDCSFIKRLSNYSIEKLSAILHLNVFKNIQSLNLSLNYINPDQAITLTPSLARFTKLKSLNLSHNMLGAGTFADALAYNTHSSTGIIAITPALKALKQLKSLDLSWNDLKVGGIRSFIPILNELKKLESLNLTRNRIGLDGAQEIISALEIPTKLKFLDLSENNLDETIFDGKLEWIEHLSLRDFPQFL